MLGRALIEHQRLYALTGELEDELAEGEVPVARMREVAEALDEHIRFEERTLFPAGGGTAEHVNAERDVLVLVLAGSATVTLDGEDLPVGGGDAIVIEKERTRRIAAGPEGVRYLSVPVRLPKLGISRAPTD